MATIQTAADWQKQWFEIADATYLNTAAHAAIPRVALHAVRRASPRNTEHQNSQSHSAQFHDDCTGVLSKSRHDGVMFLECAVKKCQRKCCVLTSQQSHCRMVN
jgi:hypothetical protein